eukprot:scaffold2093_cov161-Amphora_coffeaeformis.AAC.15
MATPVTKGTAGQSQDSLTLSLKVPRDLGTGSGGCEGSGKANDDYALVLDVISNIDLLGIRESLEEFNRWDFVSDSDISGSGATSDMSSRSKGADRRNGQKEGGGDLHGGESNQTREDYMSCRNSEVQ